jgi:hypothetical protein
VLALDGRGSSRGVDVHELDELVEVVRRGNRERARAFDRPLGHPREDAARAELDEVVHALIGEFEQHVLPADR